MSIIRDMIHQDKDLWEAAVHHEVVQGMIDDSLSEERFRDYISQLFLVLTQAIRPLLAYLLTEILPHDPLSQDIIDHIQLLQPGGSNFDGIADILSAAGVDDPTSIEAMPGTCAICDYMLKIGIAGSLHDKLLAVSTCTALLSARFDSAKGKSKPSNPLYSAWLLENHQNVIAPEVQYLGKALDSTKSESAETDRHLFRRILQWMIIMDTSTVHRGMLEWPGTKEYSQMEGGGNKRSTRARHA